jgi:phosphoribosylaminoimidazole-succinocarboxamide synthase
MPAPESPLAETRLPLAGRRTGKVRDLYDLTPDLDGRPRVLLVATDRASAFDVVLPDAAPGKGRLLTATSLWWFRRLRRLEIVEDHIIHGELEAIPELDLLDPSQRDPLRERISVCRAVEIVPIECVARGHLAGSGLAEYRDHGSVCGVTLPPGLRPGDPLPEPIFTPATKASEGHDENIDFDRTAETIGGELAERLRATTLALFTAAREIAAARGLVLADTKFEFGVEIGPDGRTTERLLLADEILTPDSSRWWPAEAVGHGAVPRGFDKQPLRDWLQAEFDAGRWNKQPPGPRVPDEVREAMLASYREVAVRLGALQRGADGRSAEDRQ